MECVICVSVENDLLACKHGVALTILESTGRRWRGLLSAVDFRTCIIFNKTVEGNSELHHKKLDSKRNQRLWNSSKTKFIYINIYNDNNISTDTPPDNHS